MNRGKRVVCQAIWGKCLKGKGNHLFGHFFMKLKEYFEPFLKYKKDGSKSISTHRQYARFINCLNPIGDKELFELKKNDDVLIKIEGRKHGRFGEQRAIVIFRMFLKWLEDEGIQLPFKWEKITNDHPEPTDQYHLTQSDFEDFVNRISTHTFYGLRDRVFYELLWSTGLRVSEALAIDMKDIDFDAGEIFVHTLKGGEGNKVYMSDRMIEWLKIYLDKKPEHEALFVNCYLGDAKRMARITVTENNLKYRKKFGITKQLNHMSFRRGFATFAMQNGADIKQVQQLARHKSPKTTLRAYLKFEKLQLRGVHNKIFSQANKSVMTEATMNLLNGNKKREEY